MNTNLGMIQWLPLWGVVILNALPAAGFAQGVTFTNRTFNAGSNPLYAAVADFNGDGTPDVVAENYYFNPGSLVTVLTNNGSGSFVTNQLLSSYPYLNNSANCIVAADINGDGWPDVINLNGPNEWVTVFTNNGNGRLVFDAALNVNATPRYVAVADVNGDGKPDLISANITPSELTVFTNNGHGGFAFSASPSLGSSPISVVAADVNGDGKPDLITGNAGSTLTVLTNSGGRFGVNATLTAGINMDCLAAADINGDGWVDLIGGGNNTLMIFTNNGSGVFGSNATLAAGSGVRYVTVADVNGDGYPDLISANYGANTVTVFTNNGAGIFSSNATFNVGSGPECVLAADVNGDGKPDLITANYGDSTITVLINTTPFPYLPPLKLTASGGQLKLNWAAWVTNYVLESATNLPASNWTAVTTGASGLAGVTVTNTNPAQFFRLHQF